MNDARALLILSLLGPLAGLACDVDGAGAELTDSEDDAAIEAALDSLPEVADEGPDGAATSASALDLALAYGAAEPSAAIGASPLVVYADADVGQDAKALPKWSYPDLSQELWPNHPDKSLAANIAAYTLPAYYGYYGCQSAYFSGNCIWLTWPQMQVSGTYQDTRSIEVFKPQWRSLFTSATYAGSWPHDTEPAGAVAELVQGLAHDDTHWYVSKRYGIFKIPVGADLEDEWNNLWVAKTGIPASVAANYDHIGDIDYYDGKILAPLEIYDNPNLVPPRLLIFDTNLNLLGYKDFPPWHQTQAGWVAVNPINGYLYSTAENGRVKVYDWRAPGTELEHLYTIQLSAIPGGMGQGAAFSPSGHLYFASQNDDGFYLRVFELLGRTGTLKFSWNGAPVSPLIEGIDIWDTTDVPGKHPDLKGQIHVMGLNVDALDDNWYIFHFDVNNRSLL